MSQQRHRAQCKRLHSSDDKTPHHKGKYQQLPPPPLPPSLPSTRSLSSSSSFPSSTPFASAAASTPHPPPPPPPAWSSSSSCSSCFFLLFFLSLYRIIGIACGQQALLIVLALCLASENKYCKCLAYEKHTARLRTICKNTGLENLYLRHGRLSAEPQSYAPVLLLIPLTLWPKGSQPMKSVWASGALAFLSPARGCHMT